MPILGFKLARTTRARRSSGDQKPSTETPDGGAGSVFRAFLEGATRPSVSAVKIALAVLATVFLCLATIPPYLISSDYYRVYLMDPWDTQTIVTNKVMREAPLEEPAVMVFGTSVMVRCLESDEVLAGLITERTSIEMKVLGLATDAQAAWEMEAITDRLQPPPGSVLIIEFTPGLLGISLLDEGPSSLMSVTKWPKLGFVSGALDDAARNAGIEVPSRTGIWTLDNANFLIGHRRTVIKNVLFGPPDLRDPLEVDWLATVNSPEFWQSEIELLPQLAKDYEDNSAAGYSALTRMIERLAAKGDISVVVVEGPTNPRWKDVVPARAFFQRYRSDLQSFADAHGAVFLPIAEAANLGPNDFADYEGHIMNAEARSRCTSALAQGVIDALDAKE